MLGLAEGCSFLKYLHPRPIPSLARCGPLPLFRDLLGCLFSSDWSVQSWLEKPWRGGVEGVDACRVKLARLGLCSTGQCGQQIQAIAGRIVVFLSWAGPFHHLHIRFNNPRALSPAASVEGGSRTNCTLAFIWSSNAACSSHLLGEREN